VNAAVLAAIVIFDVRIILERLRMLVAEREPMTAGASRSGD
jgi:hypothetical protein